MRILTESWKYIVKNILFVLPFAVIPALFMALSFDYEAIREVVFDFPAGETGVSFFAIVRCWSFLSFSSGLDFTYSVLAVCLIAVSMTFMLALVEKHMRIGKRTLNGLGTIFKERILFVAVITLVFLAIYELWGLILSALIFFMANVSPNPVAFYLFGTVIVLLMVAALICFINVFYLWYPCLQMTGFNLFEAFRYSYFLLVKIWGKLFVSLFLCLLGAFVVIAVSAAFLPAFAFRIVMFALSIFLFLDFGVRMETTYFTVDKLDREDIIRSYREL